MTTLWMIVGCGVLAILYGIWATRSVLAADAGSAKMQEISAAVREGARDAKGPDALKFTQCA